MQSVLANILFIISIAADCLKYLCCDRPELEANSSSEIIDYTILAGACRASVDSKLFIK